MHPIRSRSRTPLSRLFVLSSVQTASIPPPVIRCLTDRIPRIANERMADATAAADAAAECAHKLQIPLSKIEKSFGNQIYHYVASSPKPPCSHRATTAHVRAQFARRSTVFVVMLLLCVCVCFFCPVCVCVCVRSLSLARSVRIRRTCQ